MHHLSKAHGKELLQPFTWHGVGIIAEKHFASSRVLSNFERDRFVFIPTLIGQWLFCSESDRRYSGLSVKMLWNEHTCHRELTVLTYQPQWYVNNCRYNCTPFSWYWHHLVHSDIRLGTETGKQLNFYFFSLFAELSSVLFKITVYMLSKNSSRGQFVIFYQRRINCNLRPCFYLAFKEIGFYISCKISPKETDCMNYQSLFSARIAKKLHEMSKACFLRK